ncbi:hypothetical protein [Rhizobium tibeticum]|uniref:hypothetical protein n=1 Tax=Rhizobium tibeticum TaxID=501024 RepID=UPI0009304F30|nr:hypothetical protein [Rhizobium tibeticum]
MTISDRASRLIEILLSSLNDFVNFPCLRSSSGDPPMAGFFGSAIATPRLIVIKERLPLP